MHLVGASLPLDLLEDGDQDARATDVVGDIPGDQGNFGDWCDFQGDEQALVLVSIAVALPHL